jgi:hypothetical protein
MGGCRSNDKVAVAKLAEQCEKDTYMWTFSLACAIHEIHWGNNDSKSRQLVEVTVQTSPPGG